MNKLKQKPPLPHTKPPTQALQKRHNSLPVRHRQSKLIQSTTPSDISNAENIISEKSAISHNSAPIADGDFLFWTKTEMASHKKLLAK